MTTNGRCSCRRTRVGFTLVELLVVIAIIGMLAALLMPAINSAREAARQTTCMNNQRNLALAALQYATAKEYFPGYRDLLPSQNTANRYYIISWQVALMPNMGKTDVYQALQSDAIGQNAPGATPMPYWADSICPSDFSGVGKNSPWTSYVVNTGYLDSSSSQPPAASPPIFEVKANGVFLDRARLPIANSLGSKPKISLTDIKDGQGTTLLISENVDAYYYVDQPVLIPNVNGTNPPTAGQVDAAIFGTNGNCSERGAGFIWWDTSPSTGAPWTPPPAANQLPDTTTANAPSKVVGINVEKGNHDAIWPADFYDLNDAENCAARPASNHPGGVNVAFVGGNTRFLREDIDYPVYCLLMTSDGANCTGQNHLWTKSHDNNNHSWQKYKVLDESSL